jgi:hypothetical protein
VENDESLKESIQEKPFNCGGQRKSGHDGIPSVILRAIDPLLLDVRASAEYRFTRGSTDRFVVRPS